MESDLNLRGVEKTFAPLYLLSLISQMLNYKKKKGELNF